MPESEGCAPLSDRRILVVEDEALVAMELEMLLERQGCVVLGPASSVDQALRMIEEEHADAALLDLDLRGRRTTDVAGRLGERHTPFVIVTGNPRLQRSEPDFRDAPCVPKPVDHGELVRTLRHVLAT